MTTPIELLEKMNTVVIDAKKQLHEQQKKLNAIPETPPPPPDTNL